MKRSSPWLALALCLVPGIATAREDRPAATGGRFVEEQFAVPGFGEVSVYRPEPIQRTRGLVLFVSGDGGWNLGVVDMARRSAGDAIVVGLSMPGWQKLVEKDPNHCWYPAGTLERTAQAVEKIYHLPRYIRPILVGYSSGATLVYGALAQAPPETFAGAISLGFCADMEVARPFCSVEGWRPTYDGKKRTSLLPPRPDLARRADGTARWISLQGDIDQVCDPKSVAEFLSKVPAARLVALPKVGHGFSVPRNWGSAYDAAIEDLLEPSSVWETPPGGAPRSESHLLNHSPEEFHRRLDALDLPLEVQWLDGATSAMIFVSGDGGWADLDQRVTAALAARNVGVIGWNSLRYFWQPRTPHEFRADLDRVIEALPSGLPIYVGGFSFGAEVVPSCLAGAGGPSRVVGLVLLGPGPYATFEVSPLDWIRTGESPTDHPVREALQSMGGLPVLCIDAAERTESGCPGPPVRGLQHLTLPGGHHFGGDYEGLASRILDFMKKP